MTETIKVKQGLILSLQFTAFDIEPAFQSPCNDHLTITNGDGTTLMEKSCGSTLLPPYYGVLVGNNVIGTSLPANIISKSNVVKLLFITDQVDKGRSGWIVSWSAVTPGERQ